MTYGDIKRMVLELMNQYSVAGETVSPAYNNQSDAVHRIPNLINQAVLDIRTAVRPRIALHEWDAADESGLGSEGSAGNSGSSGNGSGLGSGGSTAGNGGSGGGSGNGGSTTGNGGSTGDGSAGNGRGGSGSTNSGRGRTSGSGNGGGVRWVRHRLPAECRQVHAGSLRRLDGDGVPQPWNGYRLGVNSIWTPSGRYLLEYECWPEQLAFDSGGGDPADGYELNEEPDVLAAAAYFAAAGLVRMEDEFSFSALSNEYESRKAALRPGVTAEFLPVEDEYGSDPYR